MALPKFHPFMPTPTVIPPGYYDPALDANLAAAGRGFNDLVQSVATANQRGTTDYGLSQDAINRQYGYTAEDLATSRDAVQRSLDRGQADLSRNQAREGQDYTRNIAGLDRSYAQRAQVQRQQQNAYGVLRGGAALQAAAKRTANEAWDRQPIDVGHSRAGENFAVAGDRLQQDASTSFSALDRALSRAQEGRDVSLGQLALNNAPPDASNPLGGRDYQDRTTQLLQGARELGFSGIDTQNSKTFSATQAGYNPAPAPSNESYNPITGQTTRTVVKNGMVYVIDPTGRILSSRRKA